MCFSSCDGIGVFAEKRGMLGIWNVESSSVQQQMRILFSREHAPFLEPLFLGARHGFVDMWMENFKYLAEHRPESYTIDV